MSDQLPEVSSAQAEALEVLWNNGGKIVTPRKVAEARDVSNSAANKLLKRMEPELVSIEKDPQGSIIEFTDTGRSISEEMFKPSPYGRGNVQTNVQTGSKEGGKRLHGFTVQARIMNSRSLPRDWMGSLQEKEELTWLKAENNDFIAAKDTWVIRFHKDAVTFQLRDGCSIRGTSSSEVVRKAHSKADDIASWVEDRVLPGDASLQCRYFINRAELAFEHHPLAELADDLPGVPLSRFKVIDPDLQEQVLHMDASPGFPELETDSGEQFEKVAQAIEGEMNQYAMEPEAVEKRHDFESSLQEEGMEGGQAVQQLQKVDVIQEQMGTAVTKAESIEEDLSSMEQVIKSQVQTTRELQQTREEEKKTRDLMMESIRATNNLAQKNQELLQEEVPEVKKLAEVVPQQQKAMSSMARKIQELEDKFEDLESEQENNISKGYTDEPVLVDRKEEAPVELPGNAEITSIEISTMREPEGNASESLEEERPEELPEYAWEPGKLEPGFRFRDLRKDRLLEIDSFELEQLEEGFQDVASIRIAGTLKIWNRIPRNELARLLGTGRFEFFDQLDRSSGQEEECSMDHEQPEEGADDSIIFEEEGSEKDETHYFL